MLDKTQTATVHVPAGDLYDALKRVKHAVSRKETRYYLNGAYLHSIDGKVKIAASDGHRLACVTLASATVEGAALPGVILSAPLVAAILKSGIAKASHAHHDAPMQVTATSFALHPYQNPSLEFGMADSTNDCGIVDGTFPDYMRVIPRGETQSVELPLDEFRKAVAACYGFIQGASDKAAAALKFDFRDKRCELAAEYIDGGKASFIVETAAAVKDPIQIGFNGGYVLDILDTFAGRPHLRDVQTVTLHLTDPGSPTRFSGLEPLHGHVLHVLMPMRVRSA